jgi:hypothetical protein
MRFMLFVHAPADGWAELDETQIAEGLAARAAVIERLRESGHLIACSPLTDPAQGREVRVREGNAELSPLNSDDEPIAGFYLIEAADRAESEQLAAMVPDSVDAHMTVRELMPLPGIPGEIPPPLEAVSNRV